MEFLSTFCKDIDKVFNLSSIFRCLFNNTAAEYFSEFFTKVFRENLRSIQCVIWKGTGDDKHVNISVCYMEGYR